MSSSLKQRTIYGLFWSFTGNFANQGVTFVVGIILARLLTAKEYGLIGMTTVFIVISQTIIDSGFTQALIRKNNCTVEDYSTVFFFNLVIGILFYLILFVTAGFISSFFNEPELLKIIRIISINIIINSLAIVQATILTKQLNFKLLTKISFFSALFSGTLGIILAYKGFGVWSLVWRTISGSVLTLIFLWTFSDWRPKTVFSKKSFKDLFGFGSKLLASNLIDQIYWNIYYIVIGKYFSTQTLGYYTRAEMFKNLPSQNITTIINNVAYPSLSQIQDDQMKLKESFIKILLPSVFITAVLIFGIISLSKPIIIVLLGERWLPAAEILQLLAFSALLYPASLFNITIMKIKHRSDLVLKIEIIKKILAVPTILASIFFGMKAMIIFIVFNSFIDWGLNSFFAGRMIKYPIKEQVKDIIPALFVSAFMGFIVFVSTLFLSSMNPVFLVLQVILGFFVIIIFGETIQLTPYIIIKEIVIKLLKSRE